MNIEPVPLEGFQVAMNYVDNEDFQNSTLNPMLMLKVLAGADVDYIKDDFESFGLVVDNPVPVNGPIGQQTYLSRLQTLEGQGFVFHRLGSEGVIDVYEVISFDGKHHLEIFMDMYHPRRSRLPIRGFRLVEAPQALTGFTSRKESFPVNFIQDLAEEHELLRRAYATPEQMEPIIGHLINLFFESDEDSEEFGDGQDYPSEVPDWRKLVSEEDWAKARETRGLIVPTSKEGLRVFPGPSGIYGWTPSAAKAKRMKMKTDDLYDPVAVMVIEGINMYFDLLSEDAEDSFWVSPDHVYHDEEGFYTSFTTKEESWDLSQALDLMDFLTEFYFRFRIYPIKAWFSTGDGISNQSQPRVGHLNFRWMSSMSFLGSTYESRQSNAMRKKPFAINRNGSLTKLDPVSVGTCPFCGEESVIWATAEKRLDIKHYQEDRQGKAGGRLSADEREAMITGSHEWCLTLP